LSGISDSDLAFQGYKAFYASRKYVPITHLALVEMACSSTVAPRDAE
jgi:hypothetical protein